MRAGQQPRPPDAGGIDLLAAATGESADEMRTDRRALVRGLLGLGETSLGLLRDYASDDPEVRAAARARWAELAALMPTEDPDPRPGREPGLDPAARERLRASLSRVVATLEDLKRETIDQQEPDAPRR